VGDFFRRGGGGLLHFCHGRQGGSIELVAQSADRRPEMAHFPLHLSLVGFHGWLGGSFHSENRRKGNIDQRV
jgi:hypothetical protein